MPIVFISNSTCVTVSFYADIRIALHLQLHVACCILLPATLAIFSTFNIVATACGSYIKSHHFVG